MEVNIPLDPCDVDAVVQSQSWQRVPLARLPMFLRDPQPW
jgi:hypothetical protein